MKKVNKKALYESIMKSVAKTVKHALNEASSNRRKITPKYAIYYVADGEEELVDEFTNKYVALSNWINAAAEFLSYGPDDT